ncbi:MAG: tRNA (guanosine(37)-N1)-methyltransferase TrmD [Pseudomonadota bacterium]
MWRATVLTLFPELFPGPLDVSILGRARANNLWSLDTVNIRDFSDNAYGSVDDTPAGGGAGMVMRADILAKAIDSTARDHRPVLAPSPRGRPFTQDEAAQLAKGDGVVVLCGRFEGIDERLLDARNIDEISIGDFVLAGGEIPAMTLIEACVRLIPDVVGNEMSLEEESFTSSEDGRLLEYPQYTRPREFEGRAIPETLLSGDHKRIADWRHAEAIRITRARRPDLLASPPEGLPPKRSKP